MSELKVNYTAEQARSDRDAASLRAQPEVVEAARKVLADVEQAITRMAALGGTEVQVDAFGSWSRLKPPVAPLANYNWAVAAVVTEALTAAGYTVRENANAPHNAIISWHTPRPNYV